ncbi:MAG: glycosyltransferase family 4 protein [Alphaproteobacteria bacterium]|nr:glycosyltransferase family 4 protein [Alphaproteobacteria bacterium]
MSATGQIHKPKKVLHILEPEPNGEIGGVDMHLLEFLKSQKNNKNFKHVIFINQNQSYKEMLEKENIDYLFFDKSLGYYNHIKSLATWLKNNDVHIINSHGYDANYITYFIKKVFCRTNKAPVVICCQGWVQDTLFLKIKTFLDVYTYRIATILIVVGEHMLSIQSKYPKKTVEYIPNGVFPLEITKKMDIRKKLGISLQDKVIACVGRLSSEKRMDIYLKACKEIVSQYDKNIKFLIVGSGSQKRNLTGLAKKLELQDKVIFTGLILDRNELANIYNEIEFLMLTSDTEGTPRVILEAMSCSRPIIATNVGGIKKLVIDNENGYLVPKEDYTSLAKYAIELLKNEKKRTILGKKSYEIYKKKFTMDQQGKLINKVYNKVLGLS